MFYIKKIKKLTQEIEQLKSDLNKSIRDFEQLKYDLGNLPKYKKGDVLENGTIITNVIKVDNHYLNGIGSFFNMDRCIKKYHWRYEGLFKKNIIEIL